MNATYKALNDCTAQGYSSAHKSPKLVERNNFYFSSCSKASKKKKKKKWAPDKRKNPRVNEFNPRIRFKKYEKNHPSRKLTKCKILFRFFDTVANFKGSYPSFFIPSSKKKKLLRNFPTEKDFRNYHLGCRCTLKTVIVAVFSGVRGCRENPFTPFFHRFFPVSVETIFERYLNYFS